MIERKDIQKELLELSMGMDTQNVYSQLTFFLTSLARSKELPRMGGYQMAMIIGLLSDSYLGLFIEEHVK